MPKAETAISLASRGAKRAGSGDPETTKRRSKVRTTAAGRPSKALKRPQAAKPATATKAPKVLVDARTAAKAPRAPKADTLLSHVMKTIDGELDKLDKQDGTKSQDRERASRALSQMVNSLEKAVAMQRAITNDKTQGSRKKSKEVLADAEDLRREIADRISRLKRGGGLAARPAGDDTGRG